MEVFVLNLMCRCHPDDVELMRKLVKPSTHRFTETNWAAFVLSTWKVLTEGRMPTPDTAVTGMLDWIRNREENMVVQLQKASIGSLYNCTVLNEAQAVLTKELEVLARWLDADQVGHGSSLQKPVAASTGGVVDSG
eukprot:Blabericola_migrator_1__3786@NODE_2138_length_3220_cov_8_113225_g1354_i0_p1_GENE_NODE_2138_length_3220_cov_8_113225_g1354_i0NODE_2138_length_3220_cov_8_113225_g1354_i0_p1_ORF_typecomplete_len136_score25_55_NODE_2138_length_3220_cov_8_113225_g1354_i016422049